MFPERVEDVRVPLGPDDDSDPRGVFRGGPDQRHAADVDVLDGLLKPDVRLRHRGFERIQVHDDHVDRDGTQVREVLLIDEVSEDDGVDVWVDSDNEATQVPQAPYLVRYGLY